jgi:hypothetical protein
MLRPNTDLDKKMCSVLQLEAIQLFSIISKIQKSVSDFLVETILRNALAHVFSRNGGRTMELWS